MSTYKPVLWDRLTQIKSVAKLHLGRWTNTSIRLPNCVYDHVFVGSGPSTLVRAISCLQRGEKILVIDESGTPGGAWLARARYSSTREPVDAVAHLLSAYPLAYSVLSQAGFNLVPRPLLYWVENSQPEVTILRSLSDAAYEVRSTARGTVCGYHQYHIAKYMFAGDIVTETASNEMRDEFLIFSYLPCSFQPVIDRLTLNFQQNGGKFALGTKVEGVSAKEDSIWVSTTGGLFSAKRLSVSRHFSWPVYGFDSMSKGSPSLNVHRSVLALVESVSPIPLVYVNLIGHPLFAAVQVGGMSTASPHSPYRYSFCLITGLDTIDNLPDAVDNLLGEFCELGVIPAGFQVRELTTTRHEVISRRSQDLHSRTEFFGPTCLPLVVDNLAQDISENATTWMRALRPATAFLE